ncbi:MAG: PilN domain-containing protein [Actinomycetota bacterium]
MTRVDLTPPELGEKRRAQRVILLMAAVFGAILFVMAFVYGLSFVRMISAKSEIGFLQKERQRVEAAAQKLKTFEVRKSELTGRKKLVSKITDDQVGWATILNGISMVTPNDVWLKDFKADVTPILQAKTAAGGSPSGGAAQAGSAPITISGFTFSHSGVARWLVRLNEIREFSDVWLVYSEEKLVEGKKLVEFQTTANLQKFRSGSKGAAKR